MYNVAAGVALIQRFANWGGAINYPPPITERGLHPSIHALLSPELQTRFVGNHCLNMAALGGLILRYPLPIIQGAKSRKTGSGKIEKWD